MGQKCLPHLFWEHRRNSRKTKYPGLAQLVARLLWEVEEQEKNVKLGKTCKRLRCNGFVDWIFFPRAIFWSF
jgi:hypothetical protein